MQIACWNFASNNLEKHKLVSFLAPIFLGEIQFLVESRNYDKNNHIFSLKNFFVRRRK